MGVGLFLAIGSFFTVAHWTLLLPPTLLRILFLCCFIGNLAPYRTSGLRLGMERLEWFMFNLLAVGPITTSLVLWVNFLGHGPPSHSDHRVSHVEASRTLIVYHFADGYLADYPLARSIYRDAGDLIGNHVRITRADGLFGMPVVLRKEPVLPGSP
jgi:hypothetical protein